MHAFKASIWQRGYEVVTQRRIAQEIPPLAEQYEVIARALGKYIEDLSDPCSADRADDEDATDRQVEVAKQILANLKVKMATSKPAAVLEVRDFEVACVTPVDTDDGHLAMEMRFLDKVRMLTSTADLALEEAEGYADKIDDPELKAQATRLLEQ